MEIVYNAKHCVRLLRPSLQVEGAATTRRFLDDSNVLKNKKVGAETFRGFGANAIPTWKTTKVNKLFNTITSHISNSSNGVGKFSPIIEATIILIHCKH